MKLAKKKAKCTKCGKLKNCYYLRVTKDNEQLVAIVLCKSCIDGTTAKIIEKEVK